MANESRCDCSSALKQVIKTQGTGRNWICNDKTMSIKLKHLLQLAIVLGDLLQTLLIEQIIEFEHYCQY